MVDIKNKAKKIVCFVFDVDGTLTDGTIYIGKDGEMQKAFNVKDGFAIFAARKLGYKMAIITGRQSEIVSRRAQELGIENVYQAVKDKLVALNDLCTKLDIKLEQIAYIGDDINDLRVMKNAGFSACPSDAVEEIKCNANLITPQKGGSGAARYVIEFVLKEQGNWEKIVQTFS